MKQMRDKKLFVATGFGIFWRCFSVSFERHSPHNPEGSSNMCSPMSRVDRKEGQGKEKTEERGREAAQGEEEGTNDMRLPAVGPRPVQNMQF